MIFHVGGKVLPMALRLFLKEHQWQRIESILPGKEGDPGRSASDNRRFIEAVLYIARTGIPWRDLPVEFGPWNSVYRRFCRWSDKGIWERVFAELAKKGDLAETSIDSTAVRAHQHAAGARKKADLKLLGDLAAVLRPRSTY